MAELYNISKLTEGSNMVEWLVIFNDWSGGVMMSAFMIAFCLITVGIMIRSDMDIENAIMAGCFAWCIISILVWVIEFDGMRLIPTALPILFGVTTALAGFGKLVRGWMDG